MQRTGLLSIVLFTAGCASSPATSSPPRVALATRAAGAAERPAFAPPPELRRAMEAAVATGAAGPADEPANAAPLEPLERDPVTDDAQPSRHHRVPAQAVQRVVQLNVGRFRGCYQRGLRQSPGLAGTFVARFVIGPDGLVHRAREESQSLGHVETRRCLLQTFFDLRFPSLPGQYVAVSYPVLLGAPAGSAAIALAKPYRPGGLAAPEGFVERWNANSPLAQPQLSLPSPTERPRRASSCAAGDPVCAEP